MPGMVRVWDCHYMVKRKVESLFSRRLLRSGDISPLHLALLHMLDVDAPGTATVPLLKRYESMLKQWRPGACRGEVLIKLIRKQPH